MRNLKKSSDKLPKDPTVWMTFQKAMAVNSPWPDKVGKLLSPNNPLI